MSLKRQEAMLLVTAIAIFCYSCWTSIGYLRAARYASVRSDAARNAVDRSNVILARARERLSKLPPATDQPKTEPGALAQRAKELGLNVIHIADENRAVRMNIEGPLDRLLAFFDHRVSSLRLNPGISLGDAYAEVLFSTAAPSLSLSSPEEIAAYLDSFGKANRADSIQYSPKLARAFFTDAMQARVGRSPQAGSAMPFKFLGTIEGGERKTCAVLRDESTGMVVSLGIGESYGPWKVVRVEAEKAVIAPASGQDRSIVLTRSGR